MKIIMFYHSLVSDWNHGNAHFLRGIVSELLKRGNEVNVYEPEDSWSRNNLISEYGEKAVLEFKQYYPELNSIYYQENSLDLEMIFKDASLVIVHEWNRHSLVKKIGDYKRKNNNLKLLFHDTHHRALSEKDSISSYDLSSYDGVLAFGDIIRDIYLSEGWSKKAWTWHEAADTNIFYPRNNMEKEGDIVWIGNWGDEERTKELTEYLISPVKEMKLKCRVYGVRYPKYALDALNDAGIEYRGWLPNYKVPEVFAKYKLTIHIPRKPYVETLKGIPTIRPFEALACAIPLITSPWCDIENLFKEGKDFLMVDNKKDIMTKIEFILNNEQKAEELKTSGLSTILQKHTCRHRVDQLYSICEELGIIR